MERVTVVDGNKGREEKRKRARGHDSLQSGGADVGHAFLSSAHTKPRVSRLHSQASTTLSL